jgi:hypothetical protein
MSRKQILVALGMLVAVFVCVLVVSAIGLGSGAPAAALGPGERLAYAARRPSGRR